MAAAAAVLFLSSCDAIFEDGDNCNIGVELRFVYTYNLEQANAFPSQVDCLTVHVYRSDGSFVETREVIGEELADESWRMTLPLPPGDYHVVAYGGIACGEASFAHDVEPGPSTVPSDIAMRLKPGHVGERLHDHFHGTADFTVAPNTVAYSRSTVSMSKTTNHLRILLQSISGDRVDGNDFTFTITDDNSLLDHLNNPVAGNPVTYGTWTSGSVSPADRAEATALGFAELSTSRLIYGSDATLRIAVRSTGEEIVSLPLSRYLALGRSDYDKMSSQEYLDRCSRWNLTFFLDSDRQWVDTRIIVNGWTVRIDNTSFE